MEGLTSPYAQGCRMSRRGGTDADRRGTELLGRCLGVLGLGRAALFAALFAAGEAHVFVDRDEIFVAGGADELLDHSERLGGEDVELTAAREARARHFVEKRAQLDLEARPQTVDR